jgi:hypothetical protein
LKPYKRKHSRKLVISFKIEKEEFYLGKVSEKGKEKRD